MKRGRNYDGLTLVAIGTLLLTIVLLALDAYGIWALGD